MSKSKIKSDAQAPANTGNALFSMVPTELWWKIVALVADGKASEAEEKLNALKHLSLASKATQKATMSIMGYVISLAPVRAVPTIALLKKMIYPEFAREVMATAESDGTALMPRIADLAADSKGAPVADELLGMLPIWESSTKKAESSTPTPLSLGAANRPFRSMTKYRLIDQAK
jgi:hypothetical protein